MRVRFYSYNGLAGDEHELLGVINADTEEKLWPNTLWNRMTFPLWNLRRAKKRLMRQLEITTGQKIIEVA